MDNAKNGSIKYTLNKTKIILIIISFQNTVIRDYMWTQRGPLSTTRYRKNKNL